MDKGEKLKKFCIWQKNKSKDGKDDLAPLYLHKVTSLF